MTVRCEHCGKEVEGSRKNWPSGWTQTGTSRYGKKYDKQGIAWHCPDCQAATVEWLADLIFDFEALLG